MKYRKEIDGLRAFAVLPVVFFHAKFIGFSGGYLGVDVFFVISGYLITSILRQDLARGQLSFLLFYERRARRILPPLLIMMLICFMVAWTWMFPPDFYDFSKSLMATSLFGSNVLFWKQGRYFTMNSDLRPLTHTWSLSIEEQFYLVFPFLLWILWNHRKQSLLWIFFIGFLGSLVLAQGLSHYRPSASFYLLPTRGWEFLAGAFLVYGEHNTRFRIPPFWQGILTTFGLFLIGGAILFFDETTLHPGFFTLIPVIGTCLVLEFGQTPSFANRILSHPLLVQIGLLSYSLYLWHQPLFALFRIHILDPLHSYHYGMLILLSFLLAFLSWKFIETPFRSPQKIPSKILWIVLILTGLGCFFLGFLGFWKKGNPQRFSPEIQQIFMAIPQQPSALQLNQNGKNCHDQDPNHPCVIGDLRQTPSIAIWGDSHAATLASGLGTLLQQQGISAYQYTKNAVPPVLRSDWIEAHEPSHWNQKVYEKLLEPQIKTVILAARFVAYSKGIGFDNQEGGVETERFVYARVGSKTDETRVIDETIKTIQSLLDHGKNVVLVDPIPEVGWRVPERIANQLLHHQSSEVSTSYAVYQKRSKHVLQAFDRLGNHPHLFRVRPSKNLCRETSTERRCFASHQGRPLYEDDDHLSSEGALPVNREILSILQLLSP